MFNSASLRYPWEADGLVKEEFFSSPDARFVLGRRHSGEALATTFLGFICTLMNT